MDWRASDREHRDLLVDTQRQFHLQHPYEIAGSNDAARSFFMDKRFFKKGSDEDRQLNNFDVAHLADYFHASKYVERFYPNEFITFGLTSNKNVSAKEMARRIRVALEHILNENNEQITAGQIRLDPRAPNSNHFFVTLHCLRALAILSDGTYSRTLTSRIKAIVDHCKEFCIRQSFYAKRDHRHEFDATNLVFATCICALYDQNPDKDLLIASVEAIKHAQQENGGWPATHPILRQKSKPWHITSHEIALCLTWIYFQPRVPDAAREMLLEIMELYFSNWVVKTYVKTEKFEGWFDDHTRTRNVVSGWATAIVCHFLSNYEFVLGHRLNRKVIEFLGIEATSYHFVVDEELHAQSLRWRKLDAAERWVLPTWPDLPKFGWQETRPSADVFKKQLERNWTDPDLDQTRSICARLAELVFVQTLEDPAERPKKRCCSFMLPGSPGTRKTTLVKEVAKLLEWPLVIIPAAAFFDDGFDKVLSRAHNVFRNLNYLSNCVIFFDEFEEFFRERFSNEMSPNSADQVNAPTHDRTIAAFLTAALLPRLQDLHDEQRCLIFLATNSEKDIDRAIKRPGRFDFRFDVNHPTIAGVEKFLEVSPPELAKRLDDLEKLYSQNKQLFERALNATRTGVKTLCPAKPGTEPERIPFRNVDAAIAQAFKVLANPGGTTAKAKEAALKELQRAIDEPTPNL